MLLAEKEVKISRSSEDHRKRYSGTYGLAPAK
jgi:hypothetical protein